MTSTFLAQLAIQVAATTAGGIDHCPVPFNCSNENQYLALYRPHDNPCRDTFEPEEPPNPVIVECQPTPDGGYDCEAWPRAPLTAQASCSRPSPFTYDWFATGTLSLERNGPSYSPNLRVFCRNEHNINAGGHLSIVVTSPYGLATTRTIWLNCDAHPAE